MPQMPETALAGQAEAVACRESTSPLCVLAGSWSQNPSSARTQSLGSISAAAPRVRSCLMLLSNYPCIQFAFRCWKEKNKRVCFRVQSWASLVGKQVELVQSQNKIVMELFNVEWLKQPHLFKWSFYLLFRFHWTYQVLRTTGDT